MLKNRNGFTLVEVIVVLVILAILAALLTPSLINYIDKSQQLACEVNRQTLVRQIFPLTITGNAEPTYEAFLAELQKEGLTLDDVCPGGGEITGVISNSKLTLTCSKHEGTGAGNRPADTMSSVYVYDPTVGKYIAIDVRDTGIGQKNSDINKKIIYYDGDAYEKGYYYIYAWQYTNSIQDMDAYLDIVTKNGTSTRAFVKLNTDVPVQVYDAAAQIAPAKQSERNAMIKQGQLYYVDFDWDDVDGPVLAMFNGSNGDAWWRGDLTTDSKWETNKGVWTIVDLQ